MAAVCFIAMAICSAAGGLLPGIGALILSGPMTYGVAYVFLKQSRDGQPMNVVDVFRGFPEDFGGHAAAGPVEQPFYVPVGLAAGGSRYREGIFLFAGIFCKSRPPGV